MGVELKGARFVAGSSGIMIGTGVNLLPSMPIEGVVVLTAGVAVGAMGAVALHIEHNRAEKRLKKLASEIGKMLMNADNMRKKR